MLKFVFMQTFGPNVNFPQIVIIMLSTFPAFLLCVSILLSLNKTLLAIWGLFQPL